MRRLSHQLGAAIGLNIASKQLRSRVIDCMRQSDFDITDTQAVRATAAQGRLQAVQAKLSLASTLCERAEQEIGCGHIDEARTAMERVRRIGRFVRVHPNHPHHVPANSLAETREQLAELERRLLAMAASLPRPR